MSTPEIDRALKVLRAITDAARRMHPELGLTFGYIGNLESNRDDRSWSVFARLSLRPEATACNVRWGNAAIHELPQLACAAALGDVFDWADRQAVLLADGKLYQVGPLGWVNLERAHVARWQARTRLAAGL